MPPFSGRTQVFLPSNRKDEVAMIDLSKMQDERPQQLARSKMPLVSESCLSCSSMFIPCDKSALLIRRSASVDSGRSGGRAALEVLSGSDQEKNESR